ncbi:MAG TPA: hypothetical protein VGE01_12060 [Fimbriimonas sp.]
MTGFVGVALLLSLAPQASSGLSLGTSGPKPDQATFIENRGQWNSQARFLSKSPGVDLWVTGDGVLLDYYRYERPGEGPLTAAETSQVRRSGHVVKVSVEGAQPARGVGLGRQTAVRHYLGAAAAQNVSSYEEAWLKDVKPGVDYRYYSDGGKPRYDLVVRPGSDPASVRIRYEGAENLRIGPNGEIRYDTKLGPVSEGGVFAYQKGESGLEKVDVRPFVAAPGVVGYRVGRYDPARALIVDPFFIAEYQVPLDGYFDTIQSVASVPDGAFYTAGYTESPTFPTSVGAYDRTNPGICTFLRKNAAAGGIEWTTFLGDGTFAHGVAADSVGRPVVVGATYEEFPATPGAADTTHAGLLDAFAARLSGDGTTLEWATFLGGSNDDIAYDVACDTLDQVYIVGSTYNMPTTAGVYDRSPNGASDGFVSRLSPNGDSIQWATLIGGSQPDELTEVVVDSSGRPVVAGWSASSNFPTKTWSFDRVGLGTEGVLLRFSTTGAALESSTFVGGSGHDVIRSLALAPDGSPIVAGQTTSADLPATAGLDPTFNGDTDGFVAKVAATGSTLVWSTYLGGDLFDTIGGITVDSYGAVRYLGDSKSANFPTTPTGSPFTGTRPIVVGRLSPNGDILEFGSYSGFGTQFFCNDTASLPNEVVIWAVDFNDLSGTVGGATALFSYAPRVSRITFEPTTIVGNPGRMAVGTCHLDVAARGSQVVTLTSNSLAAIPPTTVTVADGAMSSDFSLDTSAVFETTYALISATLNRTYSQYFAVQQPAVRALSIPRETVAGGRPLYVTVHFPEMLPADGQVVPVKLWDVDLGIELDPAIAWVPQVPEGRPYATSRTFVVRTAPRATPFRIQVVAAGNVWSPVVTIVRPEVESVTFVKPRLNGGSSTNAIVKLEALAPAGGLTIDLASDSPYASIQASTFIPEGVRQTTVPVSTAATATDVAANISANVTGGPAATGLLTILGPKPIGVPIANGGAQVGKATTARVRMSMPAPAGGISVSLTNVHSRLYITNSTVYVPAGATLSEAFTVRVRANGVVGATYTFDAEYNGGTATGSVLVLP